MFMLAYVTQEHVGNWVVIPAKSATVVAFDTDRQTAIDKAMVAGIAETDASVVFIHQGGMSNLYIPSASVKDVHKALGDQSKGVSIPVVNTFFQPHG